MLVLDIHVRVRDINTKVISDSCTSHENQRPARRGDKEI